MVIDLTPRFFSFRPPVGLRWIVLAWLLAEAATFLVLVHLIGLGGTILLGLATTVLGILTVRRTGLDTVGQLRRAAMAGTAPEGALAEGMLGALGGILMIVPGFLANAAGLALAAPTVRLWTLRRLGGMLPREAPRASVRRPSRDEVIDLAPEDWRPVDKP